MNKYTVYRDFRQHLLVINAQVHFATFQVASALLAHACGRREFKGIAYATWEWDITLLPRPPSWNKGDPELE